VVVNLLARQELARGAFPMIAPLVKFEAGNLKLFGSLVRVACEPFEHDGYDDEKNCIARGQQHLDGNCPNHFAVSFISTTALN
jgi:hypothetical protein